MTGSPAPKYKDEWPYQPVNDAGVVAPVLNIASVPAWKQRHDEVQRIADRMIFKNTIFNLTLYAPDSDEVRAQFFGKGVEIVDPDSATTKVITSLDETYQEACQWGMSIYGEWEIDIYKRTVRFLQQRLGQPEGTIEALIRDRSSLPFIDDMRARRHDRYLRQVWHKVQPQLQNLLKRVIKKEAHQAVIDASNRRRAAVRSVIREHVDSLDPATRAILPRTPTILLYHPFNTMLNDDFQTQLTERDVSEAMVSFVERWPPVTLDDLRTFLPSAPLPLSLSISPGPHLLDAASFVFRCPSKREDAYDSTGSHDGCVIGWQATLVHQQSCHPGLLEIDERGCTAAMAILKLLDLDISTTLPSEVDNWDVKFACSLCWDHQPKAMSWRESIQHFTKVKNHSAPEWRVLTFDDLDASHGLADSDEDEFPSFLEFLN
ncbi:hypothetical protein DXG01_012627 [Tephrocybe rancida]|nr:hypothetical protein DXG01_012627 [Tephrocybe rancida]